MPTKTSAEKLSYIRQFCLASDELLIEKARLVAAISNRSRGAQSAAILKDNHRQVPRTKVSDS